MRQRWVLASLLFFIMAGAIVHCPAMADIATGAIGMGGIEFKHSQDISMESENLYVTWNKIKVDYDFKNTSGQDIETLVAFPLPPFVIDEQGRPYGKYNFASFNDPNLVDFKVWVNGKPQTFQIEKKVGPGSEPGEKMAHVKFYWTQRFPANEVVKISHEYKPLFGGGGCVLEKGRPLMCAFTENPEKEFCIDPDTKAGMLNIPDPAPTYVEYILTTGAKWKGPIKQFNLTVDKGQPNFIVSYCGDNIQKTSPTTFKTTYTNYLPKDDLRVLIYMPVDDYLKELDKSGYDF